MLVLSRRIGESIIIDGKILVKISGIDSGGQVKLAIDAPREIIVDREEIHEQRKATNELHLASVQSGG